MTGLSTSVRGRSPLIAVAAFALFAAGCGGGRVAATTTAGTTTVQYGTAGAAAQGLAFARCMRSHGIPNWPDPDHNGAFDKAKIVGLGVNPSRVQAIEEQSCRYDFQTGDQTPNITPAEQADYLKAAACMRSHGYPSFPDPTFPNDHLRVDFPANIDRNSPRFTRAATTCTKVIPAGLPYSRPSGS